MISLKKLKMKRTNKILQTKEAVENARLSLENATAEAFEKIRMSKINHLNL